MSMESNSEKIIKIIDLLNSKIKRDNLDGYLYCKNEHIQFSDLLYANTNPSIHYMQSLELFITKNAYPSLSDEDLMSFIGLFFEIVYHKYLLKSPTSFGDLNLFDGIEYGNLKRIIRHCCMNNHNFFFVLTDYLVIKLKVTPTYNKDTATELQYIDWIYCYLLQTAYLTLFEKPWSETKKSKDNFLLLSRYHFDFYVKNEKKVLPIFKSQSKYYQYLFDRVLDDVMLQKRVFESQNKNRTVEKLVSFDCEDFLNELLSDLIIQKKFLKHPEIQKKLLCSFQDLQEEIIKKAYNGEHFHNYEKDEKKKYLDFETIRYLIEGKVFQLIDLIDYSSIFFELSDEYFTMNRLKKSQYILMDKNNINAYEKFFYKYMESIIYNKKEKNIYKVANNLFWRAKRQLRNSYIISENNIIGSKILTFSYYYSNNYHILINGKYSRKNFENYINKFIFEKDIEGYPCEILSDLLYILKYDNNINTYKLLSEKVKLINNDITRNYFIDNLLLPCMNKFEEEKYMRKIAPLERRELGNLWEKICQEIAYEIKGNRTLDFNYPLEDHHGIPDIVFNAKSKNRIIIECKLTDYFVDGQDISASEQFQNYITEGDELQFWLYQKSTILHDDEKINLKIMTFEDFLNCSILSNTIKDKIRNFQVLESENGKQERFNEQKAWQYIEDYIKQNI